MTMSMNTEHGEAMPRIRVAIDRWFEERLHDDPERRPASEVLMVLIHGGLRLRPGYMQRHRDQLARLLQTDLDRFAINLRLYAIRSKTGMFATSRIGSQMSPRNL